MMNSPIVGVFTTPLAIRLANSQRASSRMNYLIKANREAGTILYYFSIDDINLGESKIRGTYYNYKTNRWEQCLFPFPDVLYDREGDLPEGQVNTAKAIRENNNIKRINPIYLFDKWEVYEKLESYKVMQPYLPYTVLYKCAGDLTEMFEKNSVLYIKDTRGNRGLGVARIVKNTDRTFEMSHFNGTLHNHYFFSLNSLVNKINQMFHDKKLIIQCAIDTIKLNGCDVDMRATLQRGRGGELQIIAYPVRVGRRGYPVTSTASGSQVYTFEDFFAEKLNCSVEQIEELSLKIDSFLIGIYECMEESYGPFGEIGIDFAMDTSGKLWFIECNAKPGKDTVFMSCGEEIVNKAFLNPLEYAKYLCEYGE